MINVRTVLTVKDADSRKELAASLNVVDESKALWRNGKICAQCALFSQIGTAQKTIENTGLMGVCKKLMLPGYVPPETPCCTRFKRCQ